MKSLSGSIMFLMGLMISLAGMAQNPAKHIREGNDYFEEKDYAKAETSYLKALETDTGYVAGQFNRADALYKQEKYQQAAKIFNSLTEKDLSENDQAAVWHNLGNSLVEGNQFGPAAEAYKNALRRNPTDVDTKYNLTYALEKLKDQQKKNQKKNQDKNQDKKQDKDQQDKEKKKQDQQNKDKKKQDQDKKNKDQNKQNQPQDKKKGEQQKQPQPRKISKNEARRMLEALKNNEKQTLKKLKRIKAKGQEVDVEKDW